MVHENGITLSNAALSNIQEEGCWDVCSIVVQFVTKVSHFMVFLSSVKCLAVHKQPEICAQMRC